MAALSKLAKDYGLEHLKVPVHREWNIRPLRDYKLKYAYSEVSQIWTLLPILEKQFEQKGTTSGWNDHWKEASLRYADMIRNQEDERVLKSIYYQNPLLPLGILDNLPFVAKNKYGSFAEDRPCTNCRRAFECSARFSGKHRCDVCRVIEMQESFENR